MKRRILFVVLGLFFGSTVLLAQQAVGQKKQQNKGAIRAKKLAYSAAIAKAETALGWSQVYYDSFRRAKEYNYLKLAGDQSIKAIEILYRAQLSLKRTERFYYEARAKRVKLCHFYDVLKEASFVFEEKLYLTDPPAPRCRF